MALQTREMAGNDEATTVNEGCADPVTTPAGATFDEVVLPHLDAAYRLARWLMRDDDEAQDVVQEASLRAFRYFRSFAGGNGRAWFLTIVRNTCQNWRRRHGRAAAEPFDEERHSTPRSAREPLQSDAVILIEQAMRTLPPRFRELLALRELEGLSYRELADVMNIPIGTVMSSLSRARHALRLALETEMKRCGGRETKNPCDSGSVPVGVTSF